MTGVGCTVLLLWCSILCISAVPGADLKVELPFPVKPHPLQLSSNLFAASEKLSLEAHAGNSSLTFSQPKVLADVPFPTGAWWTNLVLAEGQSAVASFPYVHKILEGKLHVSFPFRVVSPKEIVEGFISQMVVSSQATEPNSLPAMHHVINFDTFSTTVRFSRGQMEEFRVYLVRGSPYITIEYTHSRPVVEAMDGLLITRLKKLQGLKLMSGNDVPFATFAVELNNGQVWYLYASDASLKLQLDNKGQVTSEEEFTGVLRLALCLDAKVMPFLLESASIYAVGGEVAYSVDPKDVDTAIFEFRWKTKSFSSFHTETDEITEEENDKLLMLTLPHHREVIQVQNDMKTLGKRKNRLLTDLRYTSIRGMMKGIFGAVWYMKENLPAIEWNYADDGLFSDDSSSTVTNRSDDKQFRAIMRERAEQAIVQQLPVDADAYPPPLSPDSYNFGKQVSHDARLLLIADKFKQEKVKQKLLVKVKTELADWLEGKNANHFIYDQTFGGVITRDGWHNKDADYGIGYFNDHHFHYGYLVYALAAIRKFDPAFIVEHALACALLMGDIGTPLLNSNTSFFYDLPVRLLFPAARHKDWFVGHSYASGLFPMEVGKSQESSSESLNAYYALALFSSLDEDSQEQKDSCYHQFARLMLATELRSVKKYWHMKKNSKIYEAEFSKNAMIGVVGELSVVYNTWFGDRAVYIHGINMLPFTPITPLLLDEKFIAHEYMLLSQELPHLDQYDIWRSIVVMAHAILDAKKAWNELNMTVKSFDTWSSRTNAMHWIATRPSWINHPAPSDSRHDAEDKCFGFPACSVAGDNGTALACCDTLPGCCPSALNCCPQEDPDLLPSNVCFGEHECALLGLGCCNSIDGCCLPNPITGFVLGCCRQSNFTKTSKTHKAIVKLEDSANCYGEPLCEAAKLDCCGAPGGCCSGSGIKLGCCSSATSRNSTLTHVNDCQGQPLCGAAGLDCCGWDGGCCTPDPVTGGKLDCCQDEVAGEPSSKTVPVRKKQNVEGADIAVSSRKVNSDIIRILIGLGGAVLLVVIVYSAGLTYRRRGYSSIDGDKRALYCTGLMVGLVAFFIYLIVTS
ncbi:hypothetical protein PsorP6_011241 [Peronosclerospora sorghi]|uniref:Uncharacterized protein n=1 Tax=Peronosclerospora sorghi TaxID=230839 RepID=A0ACC0WJ38_9STRA|nr:hypothetical protein PsorP6_011241 [Peronosclerospora sorghi]